MDHDDLRVWVRGAGAGDLAQGDDGGHGGRVHRLAALVDDEAAVGIAVEGQTEVGTVLEDGFLEVDEVRGLERVRFVVRERAVELEVERHDLDRERRQAGRLAEHGGNGQATHPISGVNDDLDGPDAGQIDQFAQKRSVVGQDVDIPDAALLCHQLETVDDVFLGALPHRGEPGVAAETLSTRPRELDAVVGGRVVAGREHRPCGLEITGREVRLIGRAQAEKDDVRAPGPGAGREGGSEPGRRVAHIVPDDHILSGRPDLVDERRTDGFDHLDRQRRSDESPHVIGLDCCVEVRVYLFGRKCVAHAP